MSSYPPPADEKIVDLKLAAHGAAQALASALLLTDEEGRHLYPHGAELKPAGSPDEYRAAHHGRLVGRLSAALDAAARLGAEMARREASRAEVVAEIAREEPTYGPTEHFFIGGQPVTREEFISAHAGAIRRNATVTIGDAPTPWTPPTPAQVREAILDVLAAPSDAEEGPRLEYPEITTRVRERFRAPFGEGLDVLAQLVALRNASPPQVERDERTWWRTIPRDAVDGPDADEPSGWPVEETRAGWPTEAAEEVERLEAAVAAARKVADRERETAAAYGAIVAEKQEELDLAHSVFDALRPLLRRIDGAGSLATAAAIVRSRLGTLDEHIKAREEKRQHDPDAMGKALVLSQEERIVAERGPFA